MTALSVYVIGGFVTSILGGYISAYNDLGRDLAKLASLPQIQSLSDLHHANWRLVRLVFLRSQIDIQHKRVRRRLLPALVVVSTLAAVLALTGVIVSNLSGVPTIFGVPTGEFGKALMLVAGTLLYAYVVYFRFTTFLIGLSGGNAEKML